MTATLFNLRRPKEAVVYGDALNKLANSDGSISRSGITVTGSKDVTQVQQITALTALAWSNDKKYNSAVGKAVDYLLPQLGSLNKNVYVSSLIMRVVFPTLSSFKDLNGNGNFVAYVNDTFVNSVSFT